MEPSPANPLCPVTGTPAIRLVQWVSPAFFREFWRIALKVDVARLFQGVERVGLWESRTGLIFFDPAIEGDTRFYRDFYQRIGMKALLEPDNGIRPEFRDAAHCISTGDSVLDVGSGYASFRDAVPEARYFALDPNLAPEEDAPWIIRDTIEAHALDAPARYDAVCAFQVLEHVKAPATFFASMAAATKPGGRVIIGVPSFPSYAMDIQNYPINALPHHLTLWTEPALRWLAEANGLHVESISKPVWGRTEMLIYWMRRFSLVHSNGVYFRHRALSHVSLALSYALARIVYRWAPMPGSNENATNLLMVARKPT
jgi:SAM-dependent methyltransferase